MRENERERGGINERNVSAAHYSRVNDVKLVQTARYVNNKNSSDAMRFYPFTRGADLLR